MHNSGEWNLQHIFWQKDEVARARDAPGVDQALERTAATARRGCGLARRHEACQRDNERLGRDGDGREADEDWMSDCDPQMTSVPPSIHARCQ